MDLPRQALHIWRSPAAALRLGERVDAGKFYVEEIRIITCSLSISYVALCSLLEYLFNGYHGIFFPVGIDYRSGLARPYDQSFRHPLTSVVHFAIFPCLAPGGVLRRMRHGAVFAWSRGADPGHGAH